MSQTNPDDLVKMRDAIIRLTDTLYLHLTGRDSSISPAWWAKELREVRESVEALYRDK